MAVHHLDLTVQEGTLYVFLGPNGAGKTTTIRMITGILQPDSGELRIFGQSYQKNRGDILNRIGYIPDRPFLYGKLSANELIRFMGSLRRLDPNFTRKRGKELLAQFQLIEFQDELIERFSHGMKQKLVMTLALLHDPDLLVVDEPMVGLDPRAALHVKQMLTQLARSGKTVFMSTHTLEVAAQLCDRVGIIHKGRMVADESLKGLTAKMATKDGDLEAVFMALTADALDLDEGVPV
ncbi:MAG: ABC transporter ATP-binding protein [Acidobacteria bacterium]|nr:ABC transporter ATP-binding protein [Acidobacteriota bacterium]